MVLPQLEVVYRENVGLLTMSETAQSWDSYIDTLLVVLDELRPKRVLEYGSGKSTQVLAMSPSVEQLRTVEHDKEWFDKAKQQAFINTELIYEPNGGAYSLSHGGGKYDLIFVDGIERPACLDVASYIVNFNGAVILHDAARSEYANAISRWPFCIDTDDGHTKTMTHSYEINEMLKSKLFNLVNIIGVKS